MAKKNYKENICDVHFLRRYFPGNFPKIFLTGLSMEHTLGKMPYFHLNSWCGNFLERHSFRVVLGDLPETMWKLCVSAKFPHHEIG